VNAIAEVPLTKLRRRMMLGRARMHLDTARWLAELREDWQWAAACVAGMEAIAAVSPDADDERWTDPRLGEGLLKGVEREDIGPPATGRDAWAVDDVTVKVAAQLLNISVRAVLHLLEDGRLRGTRVPPHGRWLVKRRSITAVRTQW
jgi:excisionase family DNA binding protein